MSTGGDPFDTLTVQLAELFQDNHYGCLAYSGSELILLIPYLNRFGKTGPLCIVYTESILTHGHGICIKNVHKVEVS